VDLLKQINEKISSTPDLSAATGLRSILTHIEIAERHHHRAKAERDEHLFTDVIYRANHAFEGILKEAYGMLAEKSGDLLSPNEIEEYLLTSKILRARVADLLKIIGSTGEIHRPMTINYSFQSKRAIWQS